MVVEMEVSSAGPMRINSPQWKVSPGSGRRGRPEADSVAHVSTLSIQSSS